MRLGQIANMGRRALSTLWVAEARFRGVQIKGPVLFLGRPMVSVFPGSQMMLSGNNSFMSSPRCNPLGNASKCVLRTLTASALLEIGKNVGMSSTSVCAAVEVKIGEGTIIGAGAMIFDTDFHDRVSELQWGEITPRICKPVSIGKGCFLGTRCIITKGVTIGDGAIIGAGSVVTKDVPPMTTAVGNPARIIPSAST